jgi:hypothetical protein
MRAVLNPITRSAYLTYGDETIYVFFDELDEWVEVTINDMRIFVHFDYQPRNDFGSQKDWLNYMLQAYPFDDMDYEHQLITNVKLEL